MKKNKLRLKIEKNKNLRNYLTIRTDFLAEYFFEAKTREDLFFIKKYSLEKNLPLIIIGGGSNIVVLSKRVKGIVVKNSYLDFKILNEEEKEALISVSSGYPISFLVKETINKGLTGFEYFFGLPGTVGGAIYMNSKWTKPLFYFSDNLIYAYLIDNQGKEKKVTKDYFNFEYDYSILQKTGEILLEGVFKLKKDKKEDLTKKAKEVLEYRKKTQPIEGFSSGCFFKNISEKERLEKKLPTISAGYLIDKAGLKGFTIGDFFVSPIHANFIINKGNGKPSDLKKLLLIIKKRVREKFGIILEEEVILY